MAMTSIGIAMIAYAYFGAYLPGIIAHRGFGVENPDDIAELKSLIADHYRYTASTVAASILDNWEAMRPKFVKVMPVDYKKALEQLAQSQ